MTEPRSTPPRPRRPRKKQSPAEMAEEIERIQAFLRKLDEKIAKGEESSTIKDLVQAIRAACEGGRSIVQIRKMAHELIVAINSEENGQFHQGVLDFMGDMGLGYENKPS